MSPFLGTAINRQYGKFTQMILATIDDRPTVIILEDMLSLSNLHCAKYIGSLIVYDLYIYVCIH